MSPINVFQRVLLSQFLIGVLVLAANLVYLVDSICDLNARWHVANPAETWRFGGMTTVFIGVPESLIIPHNIGLFSAKRSSRSGEGGGPSR